MFLKVRANNFMCQLQLLKPSKYLNHAEFAHRGVLAHMNYSELGRLRHVFGGECQQFGVPNADSEIMKTMKILKPC